MTALYFHLSSVLSLSYARLRPMFSPQTSQTMITKSKSAINSGSQAMDPVVEPSVIRRTANYKPDIWDHTYLMSLTSDYKDDDGYKKKAGELVEIVRQLLNDKEVSVQNLDLIDAVQRLGVGYHYNEEIKRALDNAFLDHDQWLEDDLYRTSLRFRLLRQHGYHVPQEVFDKFKDEKGNLKVSLCEDVKGMLSLYEASHFGLEGEEFLDEAKAFTTEHLKNLKEKTNPTLAKKVSHSLELPLHWRNLRLESRWYIDSYEEEDNMVPVLLDLAKLDYNIVQATHQDEVRELTRKWVDLGLFKMEFFRDRISEHYLWIIGMNFEPQYGSFRIKGGIQIQLITMIDDLYDVYGSLEELVLFTDAVERWEVGAMEQLPQYMKICYMALLNTNSEIAYEILKEQGFDITPNLKKAWVGLCKACLLEAKWYYTGYAPTLEEYLDNGWMSIGSPLMLVYCYVLTTRKIKKEALDCIMSMPSLLYNSGMLLRLANDLGTSSDELARGDTLKAVQCYMGEANVSEEVAREHIKYLISELWKQMNIALQKRYPFSGPVISAAPNLVRQGHYMYMYGDGHAIPDFIKDNLKSLLVESIPSKNKVL